MVVKRGVNEHGVVRDGPPLPRQRPHPALHRVHGRRQYERLADGRRRAGRGDRRRRSTPSCPLEPVEPNYPGEVAARWRYRDGGGEIGVISSVTQPFCGDCTRARLSAEGRLYTCLFAVRGHDLRALVRGGATDDELDEAIAAIWRGRADRYSELRTAETGGSAQGRDELHRRLIDCDRFHRQGLSRRAVTLESGSCADRRRTDSMTTVVALGRRVLPRGWKDFGLQLGDLVRLPRRLPARARPRRSRPDAWRSTTAAGSSTPRSASATCSRSAPRKSRHPRTGSRSRSRGRTGCPSSLSSGSRCSGSTCGGTSTSGASGTGCCSRA